MGIVQRIQSHGMCPVHIRFPSTTDQSQNLKPGAVTPFLLLKHPAGIKQNLKNPDVENLSSSTQNISPQRNPTFPSLHPDPGSPANEAVKKRSTAVFNRVGTEVTLE